jgi:hypothetical protein
LLGSLLEWCRATLPNVRYLTDLELAQVFSRGYSERRFGLKLVWRSFLDQELTLRPSVPAGFQIERVTFAASGRTWSEPAEDGQVAVPPFATCVAELKEIALFNVPEPEPDRLSARV